MSIFLETVRDHYFDFQGRVRRRNYWWFFLTYVVLGLVVGAFGEYIGKEGQVLHGLFFLGMVPPHLGAAVRRLHDEGRSGMWLFLLLLPVIGFIALVVLLLRDGTEGPNEFGPDPKGREKAAPGTPSAAEV